MVPMRYLVALLAVSAVPALLAQAPIQTLPAPAAPATDPNKVVLTIGTQKITASEYDDFVNSLPQQYQAYARGAGKRAFGEQIVQLTVLAAEAEKQKLDQDQKTKQELQFQRANFLAGIMFSNLQKNAKIDDAAIQKYYDEHKADFETVTARHVLIRVKGAPMQAPAGKPELAMKRLWRRRRKFASAWWPARISPPSPKRNPTTRDRPPWAAV